MNKMSVFIHVYLYKVNGKKESALELDLLTCRFILYYQIKKKKQIAEAGIVAHACDFTI